MATETLAAEQALYTTLANDSTLAAMLATTADNKPAIYAGHAPELSSYPFLFFAQISGVDQQPLMTLRAQSRFRYLISGINAVQDITALDAMLSRVDALLNNLSVQIGTAAVNFLRFQPPMPTYDPDLGKEYRKYTAGYWIWVTHTS